MPTLDRREVVALLFQPTFGRWPEWVAVGLLVVAGIAAATWIVHATGGTRNAYAYVCLIPVALAACVFKMPGGLVAASLAALAIGPWMPLDVAQGIHQDPVNWLIRLGLFLMIGGFMGCLVTLVSARQRRFLWMLEHDQLTGFASPTAIRQLLASDAPERQLGYRPARMLGIEFEAYYDVVAALDVEAATTVVRGVSKALQAVIGGTGLTRLHGAVFVAVLPEGGRSLDELVNELEQGLPRTLRIDRVPLLLRPRFGVADLAPADCASGAPFRKVVSALKRAREENIRLAAYDDSRGDALREDFALLHDFERDLAQGRLSLAFQPQLDLSSARIKGAEALIRWNNAERGPVSPGRFVPLVENTSLIDDLTRFVLDRAARAARELRDLGMDLTVSVNLSMRNLEEQAFVEHLAELPDRYGLPASSLGLELTETALIQEHDGVAAALIGLRELGFRIAVDDFGTGHASFTYLKRLPVDVVKIDRSFVSDLVYDPTSRQIVRATIQLCRHLGLETVAEGVEDAETLELLRSKGCGAVQGYYLARPMPLPAFRDWLASRGACSQAN